MAIYTDVDARRAARARGRRRGAGRLVPVDRGRGRGRARRATRCTRATASCRRTRRSRARAPTRAIVFVGPSPEAIELMGDKVRAKAAAAAAGVPVVESLSVEEARVSDAYPLLVKAAAGGGGRGMRVVEAPDGLDEAIAAAQREAAAGFGDDRVFIERFLPRARHIEVQVIGDRARQRDLARRARVLAAAPPPEGARGVAVAGRLAGAARARWARRRSRWPRPPATTARARSSSSPTPTIPSRTSSWR